MLLLCVCMPCPCRPASSSARHPSHHMVWHLIRQRATTRRPATPVSLSASPFPCFACTCQSDVFLNARSPHLCSPPPVTFPRLHPPSSSSSSLPALTNLGIPAAASDLARSSEAAGGPGSDAGGLLGVHCAPSRFYLSISMSLQTGIISVMLKRSETVSPGSRAQTGRSSSTTSASSPWKLLPSKRSGFVFTGVLMCWAPARPACEGLEVAEMSGCMGTGR